MPIPGLLTLCRSCGAERSRFLRSRLPSANPALPEIPTTREAGLEEFRVASWTGMFAPRDTPKPILDTLSDALNQALDDPKTRNRLFDLGSDVPAKSRRGAAPLAALVKSEIARWTPIIAKLPYRQCRSWVIERNRFSNRPFGVKRIQTFHSRSVDVAREAALLSGIGTKGPSNMGSEDEVEQSRARPCRE